VLAFLSIAGGGILGAAPTAVAAPSDPTPNPPPTATTDVPPSAPSPDRSVRTGRAVSPNLPAVATPSIPTLPVDAGASLPTVRTGRAPDLGAAGTSVPPVSTPPTGSSTPDPTRPAAPGPAPTAGATHDAATAHGTAAAAKPPTISVPAGPPPGPAAHIAVGGDDLWSIAAAHLAQLTNRAIVSLPEGEVASYWQQVCDANRARLRSGDLNLIYPGEEIQLPPVGG
jgi:hypothetical protein